MNNQDHITRETKKKRYTRTVSLVQVDIVDGVEVLRTLPFPDELEVQHRNKVDAIKRALKKALKAGSTIYDNKNLRIISQLVDDFGVVITPGRDLS